MKKAQEMRALADKAYSDNSAFGMILEDIDIAAREGCLSLEVKLPANNRERILLVGMLKSEGFTVSEFDPYTHKSTVHW